MSSNHTVIPSGFHVLLNNGKQGTVLYFGHENIQENNLYIPENSPGGVYVLLEGKIFVVFEFQILV